MTVKINGKNFPRRFEMKVAKKKRGGKKIKTNVQTKMAGILDGETKPQIAKGTNDVTKF